MKWLKWLFRKKPQIDYADFIKFSPLKPNLVDTLNSIQTRIENEHRWEQMRNVEPTQQQYLEARNISPDEHMKYMAAVAQQLSNVGVIEEGCPVDWHTDDGNGRVDC